MDTGYRFHIRGHLDDRWSDWLGGLSIERKDDGTSVISGPVPDQAALHGVIARIRDLGLPLLAVECVGDECAEVPRSAQPGARGSPSGVSTTRVPLQLDDHTERPTHDHKGDRSCD
ncbi:MAG TPA: hypothetical protein VFP05_15425 [Thermomicrobiales bacterium]|nr:hypothetical protein [Thermomicrobiales bacterium]